jgi:uncharacterized damage-inducible protein DinB
MRMADLRYPIGPFATPAPVTPELRRQSLAWMAGAAALLRAAVEGLSPGQLDTTYRPGGWTVRQVVHHLADAQMNWYVRTRLALTEDQPSVGPYDEARWAELRDARTAPTEPSLGLLDALNRRWIDLFESLTELEWKRRLFHPERGVFVLEETVPMHAWHGRHHTAHITQLRNRMGWV